MAGALLRTFHSTCKGWASEMREWNSGTRGVTRDVPITRDKDRRYQTEDGVTKFKASGEVNRLRNMLRWARAGTGGRQQLLRRILGIMELLTKGKVLHSGNSIWGQTGGYPRASRGWGVGGKVADVHS